MGVKFYLIVIVIVALVIDYILEEEKKEMFICDSNLVYYALKEIDIMKVVTTWYVMIKN